MKNQRSTTKCNAFGLRTVLVFMLMLVALVCCLAISVSASGTDAEITISQEDLVYPKNELGHYTKVYNGQVTDVTADFKFANGTNVYDPASITDDIQIKIKSATLRETNVGITYVDVVFEKLGSDAGIFEVPGSIQIVTEITPRKLAWKDPTYQATVSTQYAVNQSVYTFADISIKDMIDLSGVAVGDTVTPPETVGATVENVALPGGYQTEVVIDLGQNYIIDPLTVNVTIEKIKLTPVWKSSYQFEYGDQNAKNLQITLRDSEGNQWIVSAIYRDATTKLVINDFVGDAGWYEIFVETPDAARYEISGTASKTLQIYAKRYEITMNDHTVVGDADQTGGDNTPVHKLGVMGVDAQLPDDILNAIVYMANGQVFYGTSEYGATKVTAILPESDNYYFTKNGKTVTELSATLYVSRRYIATGAEADTFDVIVYGEKGFSADLEVKVDTPDLERHVLRGFPIHREFKLTLKGDIGTEPFVLLIPVHEELFSRRVDPLSEDHLYVYDPADDKLVKASERYTVTLKDGYYKVEGYTGTAPITFVIAPDYNTPFFLTAPGIALIILIVLAILVLLFFVGLKLRKVAAARKGNAPSEMDTIGEPYDGDDVLLETEAAPIINVDALEADLETEEEKAAKAAYEANLEARTQDAVEDAIDDLTDEAAKIQLPYEDITLANETADALANKLADELGETVEAEKPDGANEDEVDAAVAEAMAAALNESADATDAVALVVEEEPAAVVTFAAAEEDDNEDDDDDEDDDSFGGFGNMAGLTFIDVQADPDAYNEMLAQERDGLIKIVYRYRKSFTSRMIQSQGNVQEYYSAIKNLLLSYKGIKSRTSWNYDAFNRGRTHVAKINAKTKTLYLYLALNPEELTDTKYGIVDMSAKKKYASVPVLMKIKGDRKFKYALELIEKLCGEDLALKQIENAEEVDYRMAFKTPEEMVEEGVMKKFAAAISLAPETTEEAPAAEEAVAVDAPVAEDAVEADAPVAEDVVEADAPAAEDVVEADAPAETPAEETVEETKE